MMSHNCVPNTQHVIDAKYNSFNFYLSAKNSNSIFYSYQMTVRASVPIMKGEQIFTTYTLPLDGKLKSHHANKNQSNNLNSLKGPLIDELFYAKANSLNAIVPVAQILRNVPLIYLPFVVQIVRLVSCYPFIRWMRKKRNGNVHNVLTH